MTLNTIGWRLFLRLYAANLVNAGYCGVLGREPDPEGLAAYTEALARSSDLAVFLVDLARSDEFRQKSFAVLAPDLVRAAYRGLLGRDADPEGLAVYIAKLANPGDLAGVLANITQSEEFTGFRALYPLPLELEKIEVDSDATDDQIPACIAKIKAAWAHLGVTRPHFSVLTDPQFLPEKIGETIDEFWASGEREAAQVERILASHDCFSLSTKTCVEYGTGVGRVTTGLARRFARVHGYDISPSHLSYAEQRVREIGTTNVDLHLCDETSLKLKHLQECDVFYSRLVFQHNPPPLIKHLIKVALSALKPEGIAIFQVPTYIVGYRFNTVEWLVKDYILDMQMHCLPQQKIFEIITEVNCTPLEVREYNSTGAPDKYISNTFVVRKNNLLRPRLFWTPSSDTWSFEKSLVAHAPDLVRAVYRGLLGRDADSDGLATYTAMLAETRDFAAMLGDIVRSDEFAKFANSKSICPNPADTFDNPTLVFLHIQRTGGTSIQNMLSDFYGHEPIYGEHDDTLYKQSPGDLSKYMAFMGHFNFDSLSYIPRRVLSIFTFVREPKKRLISLYYFWRAHEPSHPNYHSGMELANQLTIDNFFRSRQFSNAPEIWNHMTWVIMGQQQWRAWRALLAAQPSKKHATELIRRTIRPAIRRRLREFIFVGLQEDFATSVNMLFHILKRKQPEAIKSVHSLEQLMKNEPHFKKTIEKQPMTSRLDAALERLIQLDNIVYEEAGRLYFKRLAEYSKITT